MNSTVPLENILAGRLKKVFRAESETCDPPTDSVGRETELTNDLQEPLRLRCNRKNRDLNEPD